MDLSSPAQTMSSATLVVAEPTNFGTTPDHYHSAAFISMRVLTIGGLSLLFVGLCCLAVVLLKFSRCEQGAVRAIDSGKSSVLDQSSINRYFPVRIFPSPQTIFLSHQASPIFLSNPLEYPACSSASHGPNPPSSSSLSSGSNLNDTTVYMGGDDEKTTPHRNPHQPSFMAGSLGLVGKLWTRNPSRCSSRCNSPAPSHTSTSASPSAAIPTATPVSSSGNQAPGPREEASSSDMCSICLSNYVTGDMIRILPCRHDYHAECVDVWLTHKSTQCPLCKHDLLSDIPTRVVPPTTIPYGLR